MSRYDFRLVSHPLRLYSGAGALDRLADEVARLRARRAFILSGRTVSRQTPLVSRMRGLLGAACAGVFDEVDKETSRSSIARATAAARAAGADLLIGVGAGSVIQGTRIVAILLAEQRPIEDLVTTYPGHGPAVSARLMAAKLPIVNVLTAPTTAQNRGGARMQDDETGRALEFFDPKTRPASIFWDEEALLTAPVSLVRATAAGLYCRAAMNLGGTANPLVEGDRLQAYRLAAGALPRAGDPADVSARYELCAATLMQNREADDGGAQLDRLWVSRVAYALSTALIAMSGHVRQGEAYTALMGTVTRRLGGRDPEALARVARALDLPPAGAALERAPHAVADHFDATFRAVGMPVRLSALGVDRAILPRLVEHALRNFNADPKREFSREPGMLAETLEAAW
ncbi:MAG: iron-containing alcohol dehydrogenase [Burkholderiales bacterium]|nr:iron-containing alcohol dehydrogenase [Burkholderiales bacterium]